MLRDRRVWNRRCILAVAFVALFASAPAQELVGTSSSAGLAASAAPVDLPDAPQSTQDTQAQPPTSPRKQVAIAERHDVQTKRILGIIPNFRSVSADVKLPPQSVKDKFLTAGQDSFDYSSLFLPATLAGYNQLQSTYPEFGTGGVAYGRYLWHSVVDQTSENFFVEAIGPTIFRQDSRYYTLGKGGFVKRTVYSLTRAVITRNDDGKEVFNTSEVIGAGAAAGVSSLYYPSRGRSFGNTAGQWGQSVGIDAATFMFKEFWPDINRHLFHNQADTPNVPYKP